uniref:S-protein homolog n=2 Tax=Parascaris univalens TaxID=6257 RepID=A0A915AYM6_PARUN
MMIISKWFLLCIVVGWTIKQSDTRKRRILNEITLINSVGRNLKLRCQSILTDLRDQWLEPDEKFTFSFHDFDRGNLHFWCDAYGLKHFDEHFDIFGESAPSDVNITWILHRDGLYMNDADLPFFSWWSWQSFF